MIDEGRALYAVAPAEFIAERNRRVKELKAAGHADDAALVAALRKPRVSEHALNLVARDDAKLVGRFADAAAAATAAQAAAIGGGGGESLRTANRELRSAAAELIDAAVAALVAVERGGPAQRDEIEEVLRTLMNSTAGRELLGDGMLGSAAFDDDDLFAGAPDPPATSSASTQRASATKERVTPSASGKATPKAAVPISEAAARRDKRQVDASADRADAARRRRLDVERTKAKAAVREAEKNQAAIERELDGLRRRLAEATRRVDDADAALDAARASVEVARAELAALEDDD